MQTEEEIRAEAKRTINKIVTAHQELFALKLRPAIRKAFPFGPQATPEEKALWNELVNEAVRKWPQVLSISIALILACQPAFAAEVKVSDGKVWYSVAEENLTPLTYEKKIPYAIRHPKRHKLGRAIRKKCQVLRPIIGFGADIIIFVKGIIE